jgi:hypothetical protein
MPRIAYLDEKRFKPETLRIIAMADKLATEYKAQGYDLTLRQLYYQFISLDFFANNESNYNRLGRIVSDARLTGLMDWSHLTDRGRSAHNVGWFGAEPPTQDQLITDAADSYALDPWEGQARRVEVWVEKQALEQVVQRATSGFRAVYFANKGYVSQSEMWSAARRISGYRQGHPERTLILHLGDHDPSGIDMTRDITDRLQLFGARAEVKRIALNMDQIEAYDPPPNPAKQTDSRFVEYEQQYGSQSWELDALRPEQLVTLIQDELHAVIDPDLWAAQVEAEQTGRDSMLAIANRWDEVLEYLAANPE